MLRGGALIARGDRDEGLHTLRAVFAEAASGAPATYEPMYLARLALAEARAGDADAAESYLARAERTLDAMDGCLAESEVYRARAALLHARGVPNAVVADALATAAERADAGGALLLRDRVDADRLRFLG
jgi:hypothetical protein